MGPASLSSADGCADLIRDPGRLERTVRVNRDRSNPFFLVQRLPGHQLTGEHGEARVRGVSPLARPLRDARAKLGLRSSYIEDDERDASPLGHGA